VIYAVFAGYLYRPYFNGFNSFRLKDLFVANVFLASLGCYVLSRRWVSGFAESFFAGAVYGFGPYMLGLVKFHPTGCFLVAVIPWLFCPAVYGPKIRRQWRKPSLAGKSEARSKRSIFYFLSSVFYLPSSVLCLLPFLVVVLFFQVAAHFGLYPIPINLKLRAADLAGLLVPLVTAKRGMTLIGFYHVPIAALVMGLSMFLMPLKGLLRGGIVKKRKHFRDLVIRRSGIVVVFAVTTILSFSDSLFQISPIIWPAISMLCCSVLIGIGMQGLISAGPADRSPVLFAAIISGVLAIITLLLATKYFQIVAGLGSGYARLLVETAKMYLLAASAVAVLFIIARAKLRIHPVRQILLYAIMMLDIFLGARFIVDTIL
jgi:hypothetical protein